MTPHRHLIGRMGGINPTGHDSSINLASGLTAVIFDTGALMSISNNKAGCPYGIEPCDVELQGIGSGLGVKGKGKV